MNSPFIYIATYPIKDGHHDEALENLRAVAKIVEEREPRVLGFHYYLDPASDRVVCVQMHPDAGSMAQHMATIADHIATAGEWLHLDRMEHTTLGTPPQALTDYWDVFGTPRDEYPMHVAGFERVAASA